QTIGLQKLCALFGQTEQANVFADAGEIFSALAFVLDAQEVHHIGFWQHVLDLVRNLDAKFLKLARHKRAWPDQRHVRTKLHQAENIRARNATKQNVAHDRHAQSRNFSSALADGVKVEKR